MIYKEIIPPDEILKQSPYLRAYKSGVVYIFFSPKEEFGDRNFNNAVFGMHLSISCKNRYPTWREIKDARYHFMPRDQDAYMILPKAKDYINVHPNCFHIWMPIENTVITV